MSKQVRSILVGALLALPLLLGISADSAESCPDCSATIWVSVFVEGPGCCDGAFDCECDAVVPGIPVFLQERGGDLVVEDRTDYNGSVFFTDLLPGTYDIFVDSADPAFDGLEASTPTHQVVYVNPCGWADVPFGFCPGPPEQPECQPCEGKVTTLTLQYLGDDAARVEVRPKKGDLPVFDGSIAPYEEFQFFGFDKKDTLGTEIEIYVDGVLDTKIHTSCSKPIGPGMVFGRFLVTAGASREGGPLCPETGGDPGGCGDCDGKVTRLRLRHEGTSAADVRVVQKDDQVVFNGTVAAGEEFEFAGLDKKGTLGTEIEIYVNGTLDVKVHTSCSKPIGIGLRFGRFLVVDGASREGGPFCDADLPPPCDDPWGDPCDEPDPGSCGKCEGKVTLLTLEYRGTTTAFVSVTDKKGGTNLFDALLEPGTSFTIVGQDKKGTLGTEIVLYVGGGLDTKIHTSCSKPIGPGLTFGSFLVTGGASLKGGRLCPLR